MLGNFISTSCGTIKQTVEQASTASQGDPYNSPSYGYTPLDPIPADLDTSIFKSKANSTIANFFTDETMRLAIGSTNGLANISYGKSAIGIKGQGYIVVLDYIKYVTVPFPVYVWRDTSELHVKFLTTSDPWKNPNDNPTDTLVYYAGQSIVPVYVGVGLRITADVTVKSDTLNLDLFGLGVAASSGKVSGTLVVQTLGVSGEGISALLPMPSELNQTTIQNSIVALGSIKSKMYDAKTVLAPRVLGFYNNIGGTGMEVTSNVISNILTKPIIVKQLFLQQNNEVAK